VRPVDFGIVLVINLVWGLTFIAGKLGLNELPPIWFTGLRFAMLLVVLAPLLRLVPGQMTRILTIAAFSGAIHFSLQYTALKMAEDVSTIAIVSQMTLPFAVILAVFMLGERLSPLRVAGIAAAFGGVMIIGFDPRVLTYGVAVILSMLACLAIALAQVMMRDLRNVPVFTLQSWVALISAPGLIGLSLIFETGQIEASRAASWSAWGNLAFTAFGSSLLGFGGMYYLLKRYPVSLITPMFLLAPIFAVVAGVMMLGDVLTARILVGSAITLAGVLAVTLTPARKTA
jgi:O-acetylserine/cysteine efflux transporter